MATKTVKTISSRFIISVEKQCWYRIGLAHVFDNENKSGHAIESKPINSKDELKALKEKYFNCKVEYQR